VAQPSKKAQQLIIGLQMESSIAYPAVNLSTVSFSLQQLMKKFTKVLEIHSPANNLINFISPGSPGLFCALCKLCKIANFANFAIPANFILF
jgi:hypothetical protein